MSKKKHEEPSMVDEHEIGLMKKQIEGLINDLKNSEKCKVEMDQKLIVTLCLRAREHFMQQEPFIKVEAKPNITICGDLHGQFNDLRAIFDQVGWPPDTRYLFMGNYVDRGPNSLETICLLLGLSLIYPDGVYLLRGNHETKSISRLYGFYDEIEERYGKKKLDDKTECDDKRNEKTEGLKWRSRDDTAVFKNPLWQLFQEVFATMPLCALVGGSVFCTHGGISRELRNLKQLDRIVRPLDIPEYGLICDLLWADPDPTVNDYFDSPRGASCVFGKEQVRSFCDKTKVDLICRAHQVVQDGYEFFADQQLVTIFSAPAYCGEFNNSGAVLKFNGETMVGKFYIRRPKEFTAARPIIRKGVGPKILDFPPRPKTPPKPSATN